jgi:LPS export ABC transporter protein LptC
MIRLTTVIIILFLAAVVGCSDKNEIKAPGAGDGSLADTSAIRPDQQIKGASIFLFKGSVRSTEIKADYIEKYNKQDSTLAWGLDVHFYNSMGGETSHLIADSGLVRESVQYMVANGHVVVVSKEDNSRLETEQLFWNGLEQKVTTDAFVTIYQDGDTLMGYGFEADQDLKGFKIKRQVSGAFKDTKDLTE